MSKLLVKWQIGDLHEVFSLKNIEVHIQREGERDPMLAAILRLEMQAKSPHRNSWRDGERSMASENSIVAWLLLCFILKYA